MLNTECFMLTKVIFFFQYAKLQDNSIEILKLTIADMGLPWCPVVKNLPSNVGDAGLIPGRGTKILLAFKVRFPGHSLFQIPRRAAWGGAQNPHNSVRTSGIIALQLVGRPPGRYRIWLYCDCATPTISLQLLPCPWMWGIFSGWFPVSPQRWLFNSQL